jgi:hypothetical protein
MLKVVQFVFALLLLIGMEVLRVYFIMPFPGSQATDSIDVAYFIHNNIVYFRWIGLLMIFYPIFYFLIYGKTSAKVAVGIGCIAYIYIFYLFNYKLVADKMFYQPSVKVFSDVSRNAVPDKSLVLGVSLNGQSKAYPIEIIGYHHQVRDTVGDMPVMITYCTVCRTGRVYSPLVNGKPETFRLVGMDHFNAMFEDEATGSWWRQVSGEAVTGSLKGMKLREVPAEQMTLRAWIERHPETRILQPDSTFKDHYADLKHFDEGTIESSLEKRDSLSWKEKSWVIGVQIGNLARAYDWNDLVATRVINDTLSQTPILIALEKDSATFHVWKRDSLTFYWEPQTNTLVDRNTKTHWSWHGKAVDGPLANATLPAVQAYQEFWHSWRTFRPHSSRYEPKRPDY